MKKILFADDEERMRKLVFDFLTREGYDVLLAKDGREALELFALNDDIDLAILDVMMPEFDGWTVCRKIRQRSEVPVIMLTARTDEADELFGFELGADEYIKKPFSPRVLVVRVNSLLKRTAVEEKSDYNGLEINEEGRSVFIEGVQLNLAPKEYELLVYLTQNAGLALSRTQILNSVWDYNFFGDARTVDTHIKKLRAKLKSKGDYIKTVRGFGYKFEVK